MRKSLLICSLACSLGLSAQEGKIVVDNQTPGWLSSLITYPQQKAVEELEVTGYINKSDMSFINGLVRDQQLKILNLSEAHPIESTYGEDYLWSGFINTGEKVLQKLRLPLHVKGVSGNNAIISSHVDSLILEYEDLSIIHGNYTSDICYWPPQHLILTDNVKIIPDGAFSFLATTSSPGSLELGECHVTLSPNITHIGGRAFDKQCVFDVPFTFPEKVESIGGPISKWYSSYEGKSTRWWLGTMEIDNQRFDFPHNMVYYNSMGYWTYNAGGNAHDAVYDEFSSDTIVVYDKCDTLYAKLNAKIAIFYNKTPVAYHSYEDFNIDTLYVPEGCRDIYLQDVVDYGQSNYSIALMKENGQHIKAIKEMIAVKGVEISNPCNKMYVGDSYKLLPVVTPSNAFDKRVSWTSDDESIAKVNEWGEVEALLAGKCMITAICTDGKYQCTNEIRVYDHTLGVEMSEKQLTLQLGEKFTLFASTLPLGTSDGEIIWSSSDDYIASVDENGNVRGLHRGQCVITAQSRDGQYKAECTVMVIQPVEALSLEKHQIQLNVGETEQFFANISPSTADNKKIVWRSSDNSVVSVDENGLVTALKPGDAIVYAVSEENDGVQDKCLVEVVQPVTGLTLNYGAFEMTGLGETVVLEAQVSPFDATNRDVVWKSTDESVCVVSNGVVVSVGFGTCVIVATSVDGSYLATCTINVVINTNVFAIDVTNESEYMIYDIEGKRQPYLAKGVNLIRFKDGTIRKVVIR